MINIDALNDDEKLAALESIHKSIAESKEIQKKKITTNVELIVKALKKIESDLKQRYDETGHLIANLKNGENGRDGKDGKDGKNGRDGRDGPVGPRGYDGVPGRNGIDGADGVSVTDAHIDFDGSLIISLSSGRVINVGEVVAADIAEKIKVITNGGGTSQGVLDAIASLQAQIDSIASGLEYQGTWNASTNVPTLASSVGTAGYYYIVATAGSTNLNGVTDWQIGDWALFNGSIWQKLDQTNLVTSVAGRTGAVVLTTADIGGLGTIATQAASNVSITGGSIAGITDLAIADGGTGQSTAAAAITALTGTQTSGYYLRSNGTSASLSAISAGDVPTLNQNTTGTAAGLSATLATSSGGTGLTSFTADGVPYATSTSVLATSGLLKFQATNSALTVAATTTSNGYVGFTNSADGGTQGYIGDAKALITPGINSALAVRGEDAILFGIASTEGMRLNSTGLGIGKTAGSALDVKGTLRLSGSTSGYVGLAPAAAAGSTTYTLPSADGTANQALVTNGSGTLSWASTAVGTVTSVAASVPTFLSISGSPITSSGTLAITLSGTALPTTSGGTGLTSFTANGVAYASSTSALATGSSLTFNGSTFGVNYSIASNYKFYVSRGGTAGELVAFTDGTAQTLTIDTAASSILINSPNGGALAFGVTTEQMRLTSTGLGIGTSSPSRKLDVVVTPAAQVTGATIRSVGGTTSIGDETSLDFQVFSTSYYNGRISGYVESITGNGKGGLKFYTSSAGTSINATPSVTIDSSGNLGIGTSLPAAKLEVNRATTANASATGSTTRSNSAFVIASASDTNTRAMFGIDTNTNGWVQVQNTSSNVTADFIINPVGGNLGLGVTPSAWGSTWKAIQIGMGGSIFARTADQNRIGITANAYFDTSFKYMGTGQATFYDQDDGNHFWYNAPSGTAGNAITFTQAMTLDASGNLMVGATSTSSGLTLVRSGSDSAELKLNQTGGSGRDYRISSTGTGYGSAGNLIVYDATAAAERARIDSSGNFMVGTTTIGTGNRMNVVGNNVVFSPNTAGKDTHTFSTGAVDVGTYAIKSDTTTKVYLNAGGDSYFTGGNLLVGTTSSIGNGGKLQAKGTSSVLYAETNNSSGSQNVFDIANVSNTAYVPIRFWVNGYGTTQVGSISVTTSVTLYNTTSDQRLKENIQDSDSASALIDSLQVRKFDWKADGNHQRYGFVAQELVTVAPEAVHQPTDTDEMMAVDYSKLVPMLVKEIQSLRKRLADAGI